jgi:hypothetical protein
MKKKPRTILYKDKIEKFINKHYSRFICIKHNNGRPYVSLRGKDHTIALYFSGIVRVGIKYMDYKFDEKKIEDILY